MPHIETCRKCDSAVIMQMHDQGVAAQEQPATMREVDVTLQEHGFCDNQPDSCPRFRAIPGAISTIVAIRSAGEK